MTLSQPNRSLRLRPAANCCDKQTLVQGREIESLVEAISERGEVSSSILSEVERMITTGQAGFEVSEHRVDPVGLEFVISRRFSVDHKIGCTPGLT
ncbi:MAG: hypothetical protein ACI9W2_005107 [Gammaproteobacteria bacterium]|jgi:hypothetical protein